MPDLNTGVSKVFVISWQAERGWRWTSVRPEAIDLYPGDPALTSVLEQRWSHRGYVCFCFLSFSLFYLFFKKSVYPPPSGFPGGSEVKNPPANAGDMALIPASGRSPGEENGNPDQYSCLENPMDRGAWQAAVHGLQRVGRYLVIEHTHCLLQNVSSKKAGNVCSLPYPQHEYRRKWFGQWLMLGMDDWGEKELRVGEGGQVWIIRIRYFPKITRATCQES